MAQAITHHGFHDVHADLHPDPARIGALGATMALNLGALLVLAMPMQASLSPQALAPPSNPRIVDIVPERTTPPPPVPIRPDVSRSVPAPSRTGPAPQPPVIVARGDGPVVVPGPALPTFPVQPASENAGGIDPAGATPAALRYVDAPAPAYPRPALRAGLTGTVWLRVLVDENGRPISVEVDQGSGHRVLDDAARRQVMSRWRFQPALEGGRPVQAWGRVPIDFTLDR